MQRISWHALFRRHRRALRRVGRKRPALGAGSWYKWRVIQRQLGNFHRAWSLPHAIKLLVDAATARLPVTQLPQPAVVLLRLNEFMKELSHFAFRCH
jgi:hypothetical protein